MQTELISKEWINSLVTGYIKQHRANPLKKARRELVKTLGKRKAIKLLKDMQKDKRAWEIESSKGE